MATERDDISDVLNLRPVDRDIRYVNTKVLDSDNRLLDQSEDGVPDIGDDRRGDLGNTYEIAEYSGSEDTQSYESSYSLISTPTLRLTDEQMRDYQRARGQSEQEIDALFSPMGRAEDASRPVITDKWLSEIRRVNPEDNVRAIVHFHEKIPNTYVHPLTLEPDHEEAMEIVRSARQTAREEREAATDEFQAPWIEEFESAGIEVVRTFSLANALEVAFPANLVDEIAWDGAPYRLVRTDLRTEAFDLSSHTFSDGHPYKTLLDNRRAIGTNQYIRDGFSGRGTGTEASLANRIKVGISENRRFDQYHQAFRDGSSSFDRVEWFYNCSQPGSPEFCASGEPSEEDLEYSIGSVPNHVMASMGIIGADLENGQDGSIPSAVRGHYRGIAPNASLSYFFFNDVPSRLAAYDQIRDENIHIVSHSWGHTNNELDSNCPSDDEWSANDSLTDAANTMIEEGTILVASAGNAAGDTDGVRFCDTDTTGTNSIASPGNSPFVVTVGAADFLGDPRNATTAETLWDMTNFEEVSLIKSYSSRGATYQGFRKPNIVAYVDAVHTPIMDLDGAGVVSHGRYADTNWWLADASGECDAENDPDESNGNWWIRAPHQFSPNEGECIDPYNDGVKDFDSHFSMDERQTPWDWPEPWKHESIYQERATGTSAAAPAVAGVMALVRDWILQTSNPSNAADRGRVVSTVLNFGDGMVEDEDTLGADYIGYGDSTYGAGRMHARLFTNHGMDSPWRRVMEVIPELHTNDSVQFKLNQSILGAPLTIPAGVELLKIMVYWDEPFYNGNEATIQAVLRRTLGTNCNATYWPVALQSSSVNQGNWLHFVFDATQTGAEANFAPLVPDRCYQIDINGIHVPNGHGGEGTRRVYVTWFYEDLKRSDNDGPCQHNTGSCSVNDANYLYFH
ncbi:MAG: S8 family serine peptidase [Deltaproteobacteria bacterium]|nr:S8 family serine peptidase [Deltaproteobacteria bacterium]